MRDHELAEAIGEKWAAAFRAAEPVENIEPEPELPGKGNLIPSAGNQPDRDGAKVLAEQLENARDPHTHLRRLLDAQNYQ
ncbi:hypothetical protein LT337_07240 [Mycolicibacterium fortuitum]|nr:hypothetical protein LT337_07240 [Mycolicibacterium fortuitum]